MEEDLETTVSKEQPMMFSLKKKKIKYMNKNSHSIYEIIAAKQQQVTLQDDRRKYH